MRIVFSSRPAFGHVFAIAPLARAAADAGHEVVFATGEPFLDRVRAWGFSARKVGEDLGWSFRETASRYPHLLEPEQPEFGARMFVDFLGPRSLEDMDALLDDFPADLVVYEATDVGAGAAASARGIPVVCHSLSRSIRLFHDAMRERFPGLWERTGRSERVDLTYGDLYLDIWPPSMRAGDETGLTERHESLRHETWADPTATVPRWLGDHSGELIFVSLGTMFFGREVLVRVIEALEEVGRDALVLAGADAAPDELPARDPRVRVEGFVNQAAVLDHASLVIHHGGAGTMLGALSRGLPALVIGSGADRSWTAESLERRGAGIALDPATAGAADIRSAVESLLNDGSYAANAREVQEEIAGMPGPAEVVERLPSLLP